MWWVLGLIAAVVLVIVLRPRKALPTPSPMVEPPVADSEPWAFEDAAEEELELQPEEDYSPDQLEEWGKLAELVVMKARWAGNYAEDMLNEDIRPEDRAPWRVKYEAAKAENLRLARSIGDGFYRGRAMHGVIDLLLAGGEVEVARALFDGIDETFQDSIIHTNPEVYEVLRG